VGYYIEHFLLSLFSGILLAQMEGFVDTYVVILAGRFFLLVLLRMGMNSDGVFFSCLFICCLPDIVDNLHFGHYPQKNRGRTKCIC
jgi:hypothetical protein